MSCYMSKSQDQFKNLIVVFDQYGTICDDFVSSEICHSNFFTHSDDKMYAI